MRLGRLACGLAAGGSTAFAACGDALVIEPVPEAELSDASADARSEPTPSPTDAAADGPPPADAEADAANAGDASLACMGSCYCQAASCRFSCTTKTCDVYCTVGGD